MKESFELQTELKASTAEVYNAWLNSELHTKMTGGEAQCGQKVGDEFTAWDGYISGTNEALIENKRIEQRWRTTEFAEDDADSQVIIELESQGSGTLLTLTHINIPAGQTQYEKGWEDHYFTPMQEFFSKTH